MLADIHYDNLSVADYLRKGIEVVGLLERTGIWKPIEPPKLVTRKMLWQGARAAQEKLIAPRR
eukprot:5689064-Karenia_brevis.AAC.1